MTAGPTSIEFPLPIGEGVLWVPMQNAQIRVEEAYAEGTYLELYGGTIGGLIPLQTVVDAVNMAVGECACLGLFGADALELAAEDKLSCSNNFTAANPWCDDQDGSFCVSMSDNKGLVCTAIGIIKPDIDTDSSGKKDAFSVGMYFSATDSVSVGGLGEDQEGSLGLGGCGDCSGGGSPMNALAQLALFLLCFVAVTRRRVTLGSCIPRSRLLPLNRPSIALETTGWSHPVMTTSRHALRLLTFLSIASLLVVAPACGSGTTTGGEGGDVSSAPSGSSNAGSGTVDGTTTPGGDATTRAPGADTMTSGGDEDAASVTPEDDAGGPSPEPGDDAGQAETVDAVCVPSCEDAECGDDGCGGSCGECAEGSLCAEGTCEATCVPSCAEGQMCGDDGCGGSCGECTDGTTCGDDGICQDEPLGDPCTPNPCTEPPADSCDEGVPVAYDSEGECLFIGESVSCSYSFTEGEACGEGTFCSEGACIEGGIPSTFSEDVSLINEMLIGAANEGGKCCFDFNGDGQIDNGIGDLLNNPLLSSQLPDIDGPLAEAIADGSVTIVMEGVGLDDLVNDDNVSVNGYVGYFDDEGDIMLQPGSFNEDGTPLVHFANGTITEGLAEMGPSDFQTSLPLGGLVLSLNVLDAKGETMVSEGTDGNFDMSEGKLGGLIPLGDIVSTLNMLADGCECLDLNGQDMFDLEAEDKVGCSSAFDSANPTCTDADGDLCSGLGSIADQKFLVCGIGLGLIGPDIDTDFSGKPDAFSVGLRFSGEASTIAGVGEDQTLGGCSDCSGGGGPMNMLIHLALFALCFAFVTRRRQV